MGLMKEFLEEKILEYAKLTDTNIEDIYASESYYNEAVKYAQRELEKEARNNGTS